MEIEEKIITEIKSSLIKKDNLDSDLLHKINEMIITESVKVADQEREMKDAVSYIDNKLHEDLFK